MSEPEDWGEALDVLELAAESDGWEEAIGGTLESVTKWEGGGEFGHVLYFVRDGKRFAVVAGAGPGPTYYDCLVHDPGSPILFSKDIARIVPSWHCDSPAPAECFDLERVPRHCDHGWDMDCDRCGTTKETPTPCGE